MQVDVKHLDGFKFAIQARTHTLSCDLPFGSGGEDTAMTPGELFLASLGSYAALSTVQYLRDHRLDESGVEVSISAERLTQPARLGRFCIHIVHAASLTEAQMDSLLHSLRHCLAHNALFSPQEIAIQLAPAPCTAALGTDIRLLH